MKMIESTYLGDGVYVSTDDRGMAVVTTASHVLEEAEHTVWLEKEVAERLVRYLKEAFEL